METSCKLSTLHMSKYLPLLQVIGSSFAFAASTAPKHLWLFMDDVESQWKARKIRLAGEQGVVAQVGWMGHECASIHSLAVLALIS